MRTVCISLVGRIQQTVLLPVNGEAVLWTFGNLASESSFHVLFIARPFGSPRFDMVYGTLL
jgi:hypothetical protein